MTAILSAVFFTILLVAGNTMAQSVRERTEETRRAQGAWVSPTARCWPWCWPNPCLLAGLGGSLGLGLAWLLIAAGDPTAGALPMFYFPARRPGRLGAGSGRWPWDSLAGILPALQAHAPADRRGAARIVKP